MTADSARLIRALRLARDYVAQTVDEVIDTRRAQCVLDEIDATLAESEGGA